ITYQYYYNTITSIHSFSFSLILRPPRPTLFPYTTLFRSDDRHAHRLLDRPRVGQRQPFDVIGGNPGIEPLPAEQLRRQWLDAGRSEEHTSELQSPCNLVCRLLLEKKKKKEKKQN